MPDICMCKGDGCLIKNDCFRHNAKPSMRQSYFVVPPVDESGKDCRYFWKDDRKDRDNASGK